MTIVSSSLNPLPETVTFCHSVQGSPEGDRRRISTALTSMPVPTSVMTKVRETSPVSVVAMFVGSKTPNSGSAVSTEVTVTEVEPSLSAASVTVSSITYSPIQGTVKLMLSPWCSSSIWGPDILHL